MKQHRTIFLVAIAIATALTLGKSIVHPKTISVLSNDYTFPESITLSQWQLLTSKPINSHSVKSPEYILGNFITGKHYRYRQNKKQLDIEMRYLSDSNGDLKSFISDRTGELSSVLKQDREGGFYTVYTYKDKAYLSACINPHGFSTITSDQFKRNLMVHNTHPKQIVPWLLGQSEFRDKRCLWAHISMPLDDRTTVDKATQTIETVWFDWYKYWRSHYPARSDRLNAQ